MKRLEEDIRKREATVANVELRIDEQVQMKLNKSVIVDQDKIQIDENVFVSD